MYLKQAHLDFLVDFSFHACLALYFRCILHEILEFLAVSFHCLQKNQLEFIGICLSLMLLSSLFCCHGVFVFFLSFKFSVVGVVLLFGMNLRRIREFSFL